MFSERKVQPNEFPHALYIANYSTAASTCLILKRWLFDPSRDSTLLSDPFAVKILFGQVKNSLLFPQLLKGEYHP